MTHLAPEVPEPCARVRPPIPKRTSSLGVHDMAPNPSLEDLRPVETASHALYGLYLASLSDLSVPSDESLAQEGIEALRCPALVDDNMPSPEDDEDAFEYAFCQEVLDLSHLLPQLPDMTLHAATTVVSGPSASHPKRPPLTHANHLSRLGVIYEADENEKRRVNGRTEVVSTWVSMVNEGNAADWVGVKPTVPSYEPLWPQRKKPGWI